MAATSMRGKRLFANNLHREIFLIFCCASVLPALLVAVTLFYLIFSITAEQIGIPEAIGYNIIPAARKVLLILSVAAPLAIAAILVMAHRITHKIVGPFDRIVRELDECVKGEKNTHIVLRKGDKFWPLAHKINALLDKLKEK